MLGTQPVHGGQLREASARYGIATEAWFDLSTGINPHAYPVPDIPQAVWQGLPYEMGGALTAARAFYGVADLALTPGSQWAIHHMPKVLAQAGYSVDSVALPRLAYAEHAYHWSRAGARLRYYDAVPQEQDLAQADVCVVINPCNPTGALLSQSQLLALIELAARHQCLLLVDEAFIDATPDQSVMAHAAYSTGLIVLRSFGKFFGLAGIRLGAIAAPARIQQALETLLPLWSLTGPSLYVAERAYADVSWQIAMRQHLLHQTQRLRALLAPVGASQLRGCALFQTLYFDRAADADALMEALAQRGILVRRIENSTLVRVGLPRDDAHWQRLAEALAHDVAMTEKECV
ncbi:MAG: threonine-phosphate decarboxylase CobD [Oleiphilaceae bacterium]|nr:threonine-phosphate decarboxylase CobD [Oleiphilaceae bacterium]